jgi:chromate reductase, NAD(P)H dehydrogenase (quinone)
VTSPRTYRAIAFSGSLRNGSTNTALVLLAQRLAPERLQIEIIDWVDQLPWMNPDLEDDPPEIVQRWWDALRAADALIVGMPEYNFNPTALAKNALDWATRPPHDRAITNTVVAFLSSGGRSGGANSQEKISLILGYLGAAVVTEPPVLLALIGDRIAADGTTTDVEILEAVNGKLAAVVATLDQRASVDGE